jgi:uncharacterized LabA/DUF88 family protein
MSNHENNQRVAVLADSQNLYHTANNQFSRNVDYDYLLNNAVKNRTLTRAIAYVIKTQANSEQTFFDALEEIGFEQKSKQIKEFPDGTKKADWDVGMSLDAVSLASHVDTIVLCTGDGDFSRLCTHLQHKGVKVEVMAFRQSTAEELIAAADGFTNLAEKPAQYLL